MHSRTQEIINGFFHWYAKIRQQGLLPFWIVFIISIYTPFEDFLLKWIPGSKAIGAILRFVPEIVLYSLLIYIFLKKISRRDKLAKTPIDVLIIAFFICALISIIVNQANLFASLLNLRTSWRYLSIYYIIVNTNISALEIALVLKSLRIIGLIEASLASIQYFLPYHISAIFAPPELELAGYQKPSHSATGTEKVGATFGTFDGTAVLGTFMVIIITLFWHKVYLETNMVIPPVKNWWEAFVLYFATFAAKKRISLLLTLIVPVVILWRQNKKINAGLILWIYAFLACIIAFIVISINVNTSFTSISAREEAIDIIPYFLQTFSPEFLTNPQENSRIWVVTKIISCVFRSGSWFGFGPNLGDTQEGMLKWITNSQDRAYLIGYKPFFDDVYWLAIMAYVGVVGLFLHLFIIYRLYQAAKWLTRVASTQEYRSLAVIFSTLTIFTFLSAFAERVFKLRVFSIYYWFLAGLMINIYNLHKQRLEIGSR